MIAEPGGTARRAEIVEAAARLFEAHGYHHTSMDDIAAAVGIKKPTLYHHVRSKSQILLWIHDDLADDLLARLRARLDERPGGPAAPVLRGVLVDILELLDRRPGNLRVYFEHHRELPPEEAAASRVKRDDYFDLVRGVIERGAAGGEFAVADPALTTRAFFGMCNWSYQWYRSGGGLSAAGIAEYFWRTFLAGIEPAPGS